MIYETDIGEIYATFGIYMYGFSQKGCNDVKIFPNFCQGGGVIENHFFPKFKKVQIILGGEGVKKIMDFFHKIWYFLFWTLPLAEFH